MLFDVLAAMGVSLDLPRDSEAGAANAWRKAPLILTPSKLRPNRSAVTVRQKEPPKVLTEGDYINAEDYQHTYFELLREVSC